MAVTPVMILCRGHNNPLLKCKGMQKESEFYSSRSPLAYHPVELKNATNGKIHYCKTCVQKIFEYEFNKSNNMQKAVYYTCQRLDIPFIVDLFDEAILKSKGSTVAEVTQVGKKLMGEYIARLNTNKAKYGTKIDFSCSDTVLSEIDTSLEEKAKTQKELERFQLDWGLQESVDDYIFLQDRYEQYTEGIEFANAFHPDLYRDLCRDRLILRKILDGRNKEDDITKVQDRINKLATQLKVNEFRANKQKTASELCLFEKIKMVDENNVMDVYKNPTINVDLNKFRKYQEDLVLRPTLKTLINHRDYDLKLEDLEQYDIK